MPSESNIGLTKFSSMFRYTVPVTVASAKKKDHTPSILSCLAKHLLWVNLSAIQEIQLTFCFPKCDYYDD